VDVTEPYEYLRDMRDFLTLRRGDAILLAEANVSPHEIGEYFGDDDKLHMLFNFLMNQHVFLAFAREEAEALTRGWELPPPLPPRAQWANFLRNHDELDIDRLSDREKEDVFAAFGPKKNMQIYERGIRRRLPPMFGGDQRRMRMAYSLMLTLPGTPVIWKGEEIGMGDDLSLEERYSVRTPMQWTPGRNGGFSTALVAAGWRRLPGLPALVPGLGTATASATCRASPPARLPEWLGVDAVWISPDLPLADGRLRLRRLRLHATSTRCSARWRTSTGWWRRRTRAG
jgi:glycosidase